MQTQITKKMEFCQIFVFICKSRSCINNIRSREDIFVLFTFQMFFSNLSFTDYCHFDPKMMDPCDSRMSFLIHDVDNEMQKLESIHRHRLFLEF